MQSRHPEKMKTGNTAERRHGGLIQRLRPSFRNLRRFGKSEEGVSAVEFAIVAFPYFLIVMAILETTVSKFAERMLQSGTTEISRRIRVGAIRPSGFDEASFKQELCSYKTMSVFDCDNLHVDVKQIASWEPQGIPKDDDGDLDTSGMGFAPGCRSTINVVRVYYKWPVVLDFLEGESIHDGKRIIVGTEAFLTEPYAGGC